MKFLSKRVYDKPYWDDQRCNDYESNYDSTDSDLSKDFSIDNDIDDPGYEADGDDHECGDQPISRPLDCAVDETAVDNQSQNSIYQSRPGIVVD